MKYVLHKQCLAHNFLNASIKHKHFFFHSFRLDIAFDLLGHSVGHSKWDWQFIKRLAEDLWQGNLVQLSYPSVFQELCNNYDHKIHTAYIKLNVLFMKYTLNTKFYLENLNVSKLSKTEKKYFNFKFQKDTRRTIRQENSCCCKIKYKRVQIVINGTLNLGQLWLKLKDSVFYE